jgi:hypothetical protein
MFNPYSIIVVMWRFSTQFLRHKSCTLCASEPPLWLRMSSPSFFVILGTLMSSCQIRALSRYCIICLHCLCVLCLSMKSKKFYVQFCVVWLTGWLDGVDWYLLNNYQSAILMTQLMLQVTPSPNNWNLINDKPKKIICPITQFSRLSSSSWG